MYVITDKMGNELDNSKSISVKVRCVKAFQTGSQGMQDINNEVKLLTEQDLADFRQRFNDAGYPTN
jgi:hypothetical protein